MYGIARFPFASPVAAIAAWTGPVRMFYNFAKTNIVKVLTH